MYNPKYFSKIGSSFLKRCVSITNKAQLVFIQLVFHYNKKLGYSFPSYDTLQQSTHLSRPAISAAIKELQSLGYISKIDRKFKGVNHYHLSEIEDDTDFASRLK